MRRQLAPEHALTAPICLQKFSKMWLVPALYSSGWWVTADGLWAMLALALLTATTPLVPGCPRACALCAGCGAKTFPEAMGIWR